MSAQGGGEGGWFAGDPPFQRLLRRALPEEVTDRAWPMLAELGLAAATELAPLADVADAHPPVLERFDRAGERIENVVHHPAYDALRRGSYGFGLLSRFHGPARGEWGGRAGTVKFALGYLFAQAEQGLYCPICLTDGTAMIVERYAPPDLRERWYPRLVTNRLEELVEGAMFLTEKEGGSDVGGATRSVARRSPDGSWTLHGSKWFCSNAGAGLMVVLGRPEGAPEGTRGLGLYLVPRRLADGSLNRLHLLRLKDKLGTRSMATGEIELDGAVGWCVGEPGEGFHRMTEMLNLSRLYNAVASVALVRRALREAALHARTRTAFGRALDAYPAVRRSLVETAVSLAAGLELVFAVTALADRVEEQGDLAARPLQRLLVPLTKYWTAVEAVRAASAMLEVLGGNGYVETYPMARFYRDSQVLSIWEGTTNILTLDALRAIRVEGSGPALLEAVRAGVAGAGGALAAPAATILQETARLETALGGLSGLGDEERGACARAVADRMTELFAASRLVAAARAEGGAGGFEETAAVLFAERLAGRPAGLLDAPASGRREAYQALLQPR